MTSVGRVLRPGIFALALASASCAANAAPATPPAFRPAPAAIRQLQTDLATIFNAPVTSRGVWGVDVRSLDTGEILFRHNAERLMMPASNMKILTLAAAAHTLGWDHRFLTTLETTAALENGVLKGDLVVRGTGDPTMSTRDNRATAVFDQWAADLRAAGIASIEGRIIGDDSAFDDEGVGPGWSWDYLEAGYAAPIGALQYNENTADVTITPGAAAGDPAVVAMTPGTGLALINRIRTVAAGEGVRSVARVQRRIDRPEIEISGSIPVGATPLRRTVAVLNPTLYFAQAVKDALTTRGITVSGTAVDGDDVAAELAAKAGEPARVLVRTESPTLREIGTTLMKVSQNQFAETFLKAIGARKAGIGTTDNGRDAAVELFTSWGIPRDAYVMSDGSGLSRYNYVTPSAVTTILERMYKEAAHRDAFLSTLPIAAKDGTISSRFRRTRGAENVLAKTGSIANVRSLSGFVKTQDGETLVFSIIANHFTAPAATITYLSDTAVEHLANFSRR